MTLPEKKQAINTKYLPILTNYGLVNPEIRININMVLGLQPTDIVIYFPSVTRTAENQNKNYVNHYNVNQFVQDICNKIYNELVEFLINKIF